MSPLSPSLQAVLELFQGPLAELRFADVDAAGLQTLASTVDAAASAVAEQEARLAELRQTLADRQDALLLLAQRALAYARVYAEHDEALTEQLARITLPRASKPRKATPKAANSEPSLADAEQATTPDTTAATEDIAAPAAEAELTESAADEADANTEANTEALAVERAAARKGKRRSSRSGGDEAHGG